jgi:ribosomal protein L11 methyltransferase
VSDVDYFCLSIALPSALTLQVTALLARLGHTALEERASALGTTLLVYGQDPSELERARVAIERTLTDSGVAAPSCALTPVDPSWSLAWTEHLDVVQLTPNLRVVPSALPSAGRAAGELYLEPAFAFGFGEHPSTRLAAIALERRCRREPSPSVLDVGTGTGILALVAACSGAARVLGIDTSEAALAAARHNAAQNGLSERCLFADTPLAELGGTFDLVVANIEGRTLSELAPLLVARLGSGGELLLSGFIDEQVPALSERFGALGLELGSSADEGEWRLLSGFWRRAP